MAGIEERLPDLSDKELESLQANAVRLAASGTVQQRQHADALLAPLTAELERRAAAKPPPRTAKKRAPAKAKP